MTRRALFAAFLVITIVATAAPLRAADPSGRWTTTFETQVGPQSYTFDFKVAGSTLTGTLKGSLTGESAIVDGKIDGDKISFTENGTYEGQALSFKYSGQMTSADEITFSRVLPEFPAEEFVAKRQQ